MIYVLSEKVYEGAKNLPCIMIRYMEKNLDVSAYAALIFSSKNGVYALDSCSENWQGLPAYAIGKGTEDAILERGGHVVYKARSSYGDDFSQEIKSFLKNKKVLFPRAKVVTSKLNQILQDAGVLLDEEIVYETLCSRCDTLVKPKHGAIMIFSSPSTIKCFFQCFTWDESYRAVVIGTRTASYMPKNVPFVQSLEQTIPSCISLAYKLSKNAL